MALTGVVISISVTENKKNVSIELSTCVCVCVRVLVCVFSLAAYNVRQLATRCKMLLPRQRYNQEQTTLSTTNQGEGLYYSLGVVAISHAHTLTCHPCEDMSSSWQALLRSYK